MRVHSRSDLTALAKARNIPTECQFEVTSQCHLHCVMCLRTVLDKDRELSFTEVRDALSQLRELGVMRIGYTGGEVFTRPDFMDILELTDAMGFKMGMTTTGTLLTEEHFERLEKLNNLDRVGVSIYSLRPKVHAKVTKADTLKDSLRAVLRLKAIGLPVRVNAPIMTLTYKDARTLREFLMERGVPFVHDLTLSPTDTGETFPLQYQVGPEHYPYLQGMLKTVRKSTETCRSKAEMMDMDPHPFCGTGRNQLAIDAHGNLYPCTVLRLSFGNLRQTPIAQAWRHSPALQAVREHRTMDTLNCKSCDYFGGCQMCLGLTYRRTGDFTAAPGPSCEKSQEGAPATEGAFVH